MSYKTLAAGNEPVLGHPEFAPMKHLSNAVLVLLFVVSCVGTGKVGESVEPTATVTAVALGFVQRRAEQSQVASLMTTLKALYCVYDV